ncbi:uncharacterized protein N7500_002305, partial [Penicillium coprophilum]|uniref:uncharacterized protein n=1 Tax=Penicillium coprophilum TaxID=36646 RepID=UPI00238A8351
SFAFWGLTPHCLSLQLLVLNNIILPSKPYHHDSWDTTPQKFLNIELVFEVIAPRLNGPLDYERCASLHNYLVTDSELVELASQPLVLADEYTQAVPERVRPSIRYSRKGFFYWVKTISMGLLGSHCVSVVYDQQLHRAAFPMTL